ncbi:hypothetical protein TIFTF001_045105 [Ficus carica]|uniref:Uncharacterized protein n=1 Tax=Ficus carica TaxID=3494 RepID=A0AA88CGX4_FICCA|nr:hypothetical protein TIFTF001_045105 [Ficus carica]
MYTLKVAPKSRGWYTFTHHPKERDQRSFKFLVALENLQLADLRPTPQFSKVIEANIRIKAEEKERKFREPMPVRVKAHSFILDDDERDDQHTDKDGEKQEASKFSPSDD